MVLKVIRILGKIPKHIKNNFYRRYIQYNRITNDIENSHELRKEDIALVEIDVQYRYVNFNQWKG